jgi:hypothetical protein
MHSTAPTCPVQTSATRCWNPGRSTWPEPDSSQILVDYLDLLEAKLASVVGQAVLPALSFLVVNHLSRR